MRYRLSSVYNDVLTEACESWDVDKESCDGNDIINILDEFSYIGESGVKYTKDDENGLIEMWLTTGEHFCEDPDPEGTIIHC